MLSTQSESSNLRPALASWAFTALCNTRLSGVFSVPRPAAIHRAAKRSLLALQFQGFQ